MKNSNKRQDSYLEKQPIKVRLKLGEENFSTTNELEYIPRSKATIDKINSTMRFDSMRKQAEALRNRIKS